MIGDGWSPEDHDGWQDAPRPEDRSTQVDHDALDLLDAAILSAQQDERDRMGASEQTRSATSEAAAELVRAVRTEARAAYLGGVPNRHHPDL